MHILNFGSTELLVSKQKLSKLFWLLGFCKVSDTRCRFTITKTTIMILSSTKHMAHATDLIHLLHLLSYRWTDCVSRSRLPQCEGGQRSRDLLMSLSLKRRHQAAEPNAAGSKVKEVQRSNQQPILNPGLQLSPGLDWKQEEFKRSPNRLKSDSNNSVWNIRISEAWKISEIKTKVWAGSGFLCLFTAALHSPGGFSDHKHNNVSFLLLSAF